MSILIWLILILHSWPCFKEWHFLHQTLGNSLFFGVHSLFCRGPMRLWKFLIWRFFEIFVFYFRFYFHIFDLLVLWLLLSVFHVLFWCFVFVFLLNYIFATESFLAHFSIFLLRIRPWECHIRILRKKNYIGYTNYRPNWRHGSLF